MGAFGTRGGAFMGGKVIKLSEVRARHWADALRQTRRMGPLVYTITNFVAASFQANVTLAAGGTPVMSRSSHEAAALTIASSALVVNTGTPSDEGEETIRQSMARGGIILLDPVGYGATEYRKRLIDSLLNDFTVSIIKGNWGEICLLAGENASVEGVDSGSIACSVGHSVRLLALKTSALVCATGPVDYLSDGETVISFSGGNRLMSRISGGGCALGSLMGVLVAGSGGQIAVGASAAVVLLRRAAERAGKKVDGPGSFQICLLDELYGTSPEDLLSEEVHMVTDPEDEVGTKEPKMPESS